MPAAPRIVLVDRAGGEQVFAAVDPGLAFADLDRRAKLEAAFPAVDAAIEDERARQGVPGLAVGVVIDGELAHAKGFGSATWPARRRPMPTRCIASAR